MKKPLVPSLALAIALGTLSACSSGGGTPEPSKPSGGGPSSSPKAPAAPAAPEVALSLKTLRGQGPDLEAQPVKVVAQGGTITSVDISGPEEKRLTSSARVNTSPLPQRGLVKITGTGKQAATWDGMGAIWNIKLPEWKAMSALS